MDYGCAQPSVVHYVKNNAIIKFTNDIAVVGLIFHNDETDYRM